MNRCLLMAVCLVSGCAIPGRDVKPFIDRSPSWTVPPPSTNATLPSSSAVPAPPTAATSVALAWDPPLGGGYRYELYQGGASRTYTNRVSAGNSTVYLVPNLAPGHAYYFAVTQITWDGHESPFSNEVRYVAPKPKNPPVKAPAADNRQ